MSTSQDTLQNLGRQLGLQFPPSARLLGVARENGMDDLVKIKVEMASLDWPKFLAATPVKEETFREGTRGFLGQDSGFWDPHRATNLRTGQAILKGQRALNIGMDDSQMNLAIVYIVNHGT